MNGGLLVLVVILALLMASAVWTTYKQMKAYQASYAARNRAMSENLAYERELDPRYQAKVAADRKFWLAEQELDLKRFITMSRLDVAQYGTVLINQEDNRLTHIQPVYKPVVPKQIEAPALPEKDIPGPYDLRSVWREFTPSTNGIFLGRSAESNIIVPVKKLLHSVATGPTGGGKTNVVRMQLMQLEYVGCDVTIMDIHYAPIKEDEGGNPIDWRPIVNRLAQEPIYDLKAIVQYMRWLAYTELEARIYRQRNGHKIGKPIFFHIAELPATLDELDKELAQPLAKLLRQGRQYLIFFVGDSQDLLTETLHMTTGPRECFRTGIYTGGDPTTAKALLDLPKGVTVDEEGLGIEGRVYVKTAIHPHTLTRVGWASNDSLYDLFNTPEYERLDSPARSYHMPAVQTFAKHQETPQAERAQAVNSERLGSRIIEADMPETDISQNAQTFTKTQTGPLVDSTQRTSSERPAKYTLTNPEIDQFIAAYRAGKNIDKALAAINPPKGSNYRECARRIIQAYAL